MSGGDGGVDDGDGGDGDAVLCYGEVMLAPCALLRCIAVLLAPCAVLWRLAPCLCRV